jgi:hypothetical protein
MIKLKNPLTIKDPKQKIDCKFKISNRKDSKREITIECNVRLEGAMEQKEEDSEYNYMNDMIKQ